MKITKSKLRSLVREALDTFQSHAHEPAVGDHVVNVNPSCKHHGSVGIVISINILPGNAGKTAEYQCMNQGPGWKKGEVLEKTLDQLAPGKLNEGNMRTTRRQIRKIIYETLSLLTEGVHDQGIFKVIFLAGGPGSGKSTAVKNLVFPGRYGLKIVNVDDAFELLMKKGIESGEFSSMDMQDDDRENRIKKLKLFNKSRALTKKRKEDYVDGRLGLIIDGTGGNYTTIKSQKKKFEDLGYDTFMVYVATSLDVAKQRNIARGERGGRRLRDKDLTRSWTAVDKNKQNYIDLFGSNIVILDGDNLREKENLTAEKKISNFILSPVKNQTALQWIDKELKKSQTLK